jgi:flavin reductase (DIM6/NTAB) family NADH-FMN oxidoreductase RutF
MSDDPIKDALRMMAYGFYCITSRIDNERNIMVANWIMQTSFEPRYIAIGLQKTSFTHKLIEEGKVFAVNIFNKADSEAIKPFTKSRAKNPNKVEEADYSDGPETGCPILVQAAAYLECQLVEIVDIDGDHDIVVGEVIGAGVSKPGDSSDTLTLSDIGWSYAG